MKRIKTRLVWLTIHIFLLLNVFKAKIHFEIEFILNINYIADVFLKIIFGFDKFVQEFRVELSLISWCRCTICVFHLTPD